MNPSVICRILWVGLAVVWSCTLLWAGEITFDTKQDWSQWKAMKGTIEITEDGWAKPTFIRKNVNAAVNAHEFVIEKDAQGAPSRWGGIIGAGSNPDRARSILDGNMTTWWSPRPEDPLDAWWVEVDLGRLITATRMVLKFAREQKPFEQFEVYVSAGNEAFFYGSKLKDYKLVFRTTQPNDRYVIEHVFSQDATTIRAPNAPVIRYIYIRLIAPSDRPSLAELEVYELGDNIALGFLDRGGSVEAASGSGVGTVADPGAGSALTNGDYPSYWLSVPNPDDWTLRGWILMDLGALYWVDTIRHVWIEAPDPGHVVSYKLFTSDGSIKGGGAGGGLGPMKDLAWDEVGSLDRNPPPGKEDFVYLFEERFPIRPARYLFFSHRLPERGLSTGAHDVGISELQVFGEGYVRGASLTSAPVDLGSARNLTAVDWKVDTPPGTRVEIRTRTGENINEVTHYYGRNGKEITKKDHDKEKRLFGESGPIVVEQVPDSTWSGWSGVYPSPGSQFLSPSPRRYLLVQIGFPSDDPSLTSSIDKLTFVFSNPLAKTVIGEISPGLVPAAKPHDFSYFILPTFDSGSTGFDQILIRTPSEPQLRGVEIGGQSVEPPLVLTRPDSLWVRLPSVVRSPGLLVIRFQSMVFVNGTPFEAFVGNSRQPEAWQRVDPGDATDRSRNDRIVVAVPMVDRVIGDVSVTPDVITPNGDGVNDRLSIEFTVFNVETPRRVEVTILSRQGTIVRELPLGLRQSGRYRVEWDGTDHAGNIVAPGLYLLQITVDADVGQAKITMVTSVVF
jgi:hypothetical protein